MAAILHAHEPGAFPSARSDSAALQVCGGSTAVCYVDVKPLVRFVARQNTPVVVASAAG